MSFRSNFFSCCSGLVHSPYGHTISIKYSFRIGKVECVSLCDLLLGYFLLCAFNIMIYAYLLNLRVLPAVIYH